MVKKYLLEDLLPSIFCSKSSLEIRFFFKFCFVHVYLVSFAFQCFIVCLCILSHFFLILTHFCMTKSSRIKKNSDSPFSVKIPIFSMSINLFFFLFLFAVGLPILAFFLFGDPYKRGFFCDDESLKHPFHDSTVKSWMLYLGGFILPLGLVSNLD